MNTTTETDQMLYTPAAYAVFGTAVRLAEGRPLDVLHVLSALASEPSSVRTYFDSRGLQTEYFNLELFWRDVEDTLGEPTDSDELEMSDAAAFGLRIAHELAATRGARNKLNVADLALGFFLVSDPVVLSILHTAGLTMEEVLRDLTVTVTA